MKWLVAVKAFFQALSMVKAAAGLAASLFRWMKSLFIKADQKKQNKEMEKAEEKISEANKIVDAEERLRRKAEAACDLEKSLNPDSDCR